MVRNFGDDFGRRLHAEHRRVLLVNPREQRAVAVTEVRTEHPSRELSEPLRPEDAFGVALQLRDFPVHEWWEDGRQAPVVSLRAGDTTIYDLRRNPRARINHPFHSIHFNLPRALLDLIADDAGARRIVDLDYSPGAGVSDPVVRHLALAVQPFLGEPGQADRLFIDYVMFAVASHVVVTYGHLGERRQYGRGGLSPWQTRRALELIDAHLDANLTVADLARHCGLSSSHFTQAFRRTAGVTPHRWLMQRRVERAKDLLKRAERPAAQIALACGFAGQSHFTRVFTALVGCPPGEWRRRNGLKPHKPV